MRYLFLFIIIIFIGVKSFAVCNIQTLYASSTFNPDIIQIENLFRKLMYDNQNNTAYTRVPRGLIVSIAESELFEKGKYKIKNSGYKIIDAIITVLNHFPNPCVVESHTDEKLSSVDGYQEDWEISVMRANEITDYIVKHGKISRDRIFPLGFGEMMPFKENVSREGFMDNRVDFVIIDYKLNR